MKIYGVIMAGGGGTRFWPLSRKDSPKQLLNLSGKDAMINETIARLNLLLNKNDVYIVTNSVQADKMIDITAGKIDCKNILKEPAQRNTSACIGYAAAHILKTRGDGVMIVSPSDAYIRDEKEYAKVLAIASTAAMDKNCIVTVGITPTFPATGYGYIKYEKSGAVTKKVERFVEKPDEERANAYLKDGGYVWNSGVFIFKASVIMDRIKEFLPDLYSDLMTVYDAIGTEKESEILNSVYPKMQSISIDYGVMEKAKDIFVIPADFGWNDVGSWDMLSVLNDSDVNGNIAVGDSLLIDTKNSTVYSSGRTVAVVGVENLVVVETPDAVLVCPKDKAQDVKKIVDLLKEKGKTELL